MADNWRAPYRSRDAGGSDDAAMAVAWRWIDGLAYQAAEYLGVEEIQIDSRTDCGGTLIALYHRRSPIAVATVFRDQMNFAVLIRWMAE